MQLIGKKAQIRLVNYENKPYHVQGVIEWQGDNKPLTSSFSNTFPNRELITYIKIDNDNGIHRLENVKILED